MSVYYCRKRGYTEGSRAGTGRKGPERDHTSKEGEERKTSGLW